MLYDSAGQPFGFNTPFALNGGNYQAQAESLIFPGTGYYVNVSGIANADFPLQISVSAFDLGPIVAPELSTWAMMLLGMAGLGFVRYRTSPRAA